MHCTYRETKKLARRVASASAPAYRHAPPRPAQPHEPHPGSRRREAYASLCSLPGVRLLVRASRGGAGLGPSRVVGRTRRDNQRHHREMHLFSKRNPIPGEHVSEA